MVSNRDTDSDGDTIPDGIEGVTDSDGDGVPNYRDTDADGDGISDTEEVGEEPRVPTDTDSDGVPDYLDSGSDGDGISDTEEGTTDTDGDGAPNYIDTDSHGDGIPDSVEGTADTDGDGIPNYIDTDSDGDGILDSEEGTRDSDGDGIPDYLDSESGSGDGSDGSDGGDESDGVAVDEASPTDLEIVNISANRSRVRNAGNVSFFVLVSNPDINAPNALGGPVYVGENYANLRPSGSLLRQIDRRDNGTVRLRVNGEVVATRQVRVPDGETRQLRFSVFFDEPGRYSVSTSLRGRSADGQEEPDDREQVTSDVDVQVDTVAGHDCELFGVDMGHFLVCWYWWLLAALGTVLARLLRRVLTSTNQPIVDSTVLVGKQENDDDD